MDQIKQTIEALREELNKHNYDYYVLSTPTISDFEFDKKLRELSDLETRYPEYFDANSPTQRVGSDINKSFKQVQHKYPMLSLGNTYTKDEVTDFYNRVQKGLNDEFEIVGIVDNFSMFASPTGASEIWVPLTVNLIGMNPDLRILFPHQTNLFLAKEIIAQSVRQFYNTKNIPVAISADNLFTEKEMRNKKFITNNGKAIGMLIFILLLVPALNIITLNRANTRNRAKEIAIRKTFGASKLSSFFLILFENLILALAGVFIGILLAKPGMTLLLNSLFDELNMLSMLMPEVNILVVAGSILPLMLLFVIMFSGLPAWLAAKCNITDTLKGGKQ
jgi:ABC-type antimicrobial peptide transport system permease subunit